MRRAVAIAVLATLPAACAVRRHAAAPPSPYCRGGNVLAGVYHPQRLRVRSRCRVVTGTVTSVKFEDFDGDVHLDLRPDEQNRLNRGVVTRGNSQVGGDLVVEIIPQDRALVGVPQPGARVTVVGAWVEDEKHGWLEIHPTWLVSPSTILPASPRELGRAQLLLRGGTYDVG